MLPLRKATPALDRLPPVCYNMGVRRHSRHRLRPMSFNDFLALYYRTHNPEDGQRMGQYFMNFLHEFKPDLYRTIPPDLDPYHNDKLLPACMGWVSDRWEAPIQNPVKGGN